MQNVGIFVQCIQAGANCNGLSEGVNGALTDDIARHYHQNMQNYAKMIGAI